MEIRLERRDDVGAIRDVNLAAFDTRVEADLVDALRNDTAALMSLVAQDQQAIVGHILFSPAILSGHPELKIVALAPMAVVPPRQRQGIGSALVTEGLDRCRRTGAVAVVVLGHAGYYPRFGFRPASRFGITCEYEVPDDVFMALELHDGILAGRSGTVAYHPVFGRF